MNNLWEIRQWRIDADGKLYGTITEKKNKIRVIDFGNPEDEEISIIWGYKLYYDNDY